MYKTVKKLITIIGEFIDLQRSAIAGHALSGRSSPSLASQNSYEGSFEFPGETGIDQRIHGAVAVSQPEDHLEQPNGWSATLAQGFWLRADMVKGVDA